GTSNLAEAQKITVRLAQVISDMNMALLPTRTARITGTAVDSRDRPFVGSVMAFPKDNTMMVMSFGPPAMIRPDGSFTLSGVTPGEYSLQTAGMGGQNAEFASVDVTVNGDDITGVRLVGALPLTVSGRVIVEPAAAQSLPVQAIRLMVQPVQFGPPMLGSSGPSPVNDDLTFEVKGRPGKMHVVLIGQVPGW